MLPERRYIIRFDDIAPNMNWENLRRIEAKLDAHDVKPLLGVIPDNRDPSLIASGPVRDDFWPWLRKARDKGWDIALHGYQHLYVTKDSGLLRLNPVSEFAGLSLELQLEKLTRGLELLRAQGLDTDTFMAPAHSYDRATLKALGRCGFRYVTDGDALFPYEEEGLVFVPQLFARPLPLPLGIQTTCIHLNELHSNQIAALERFIERRHHQVIRFHDATRFLTGSRLNRVLGGVARRGMIVPRLVRRGIRRALDLRAPLDRNERR